MRMTRMNSMRRRKKEQENDGSDVTPPHRHFPLQLPARLNSGRCDAASSLLHQRITFTEK